MPGRMSGFSGLRAVLSLVAGPALRACALSYPWPQVRVFRLARCPIPDGMSGFSGLRAVLSLCGAIADPDPDADPEFAFFSLRAVRRTKF